MFLLWRDDTPAYFNIGPNGSLVAAGDSAQSALQPLSSSGTPRVVSDTFAQVQETILFSPDNATIVSSSQGVQVPPTTPSTSYIQPPAASPATATTLVQSTTLTMTQTATRTSQPPPLPAVTTTIQSVSVSVSQIVSISRVSDVTTSSTIGSTSTASPNSVIETTSSTSTQVSSSEDLVENTSATSQAVSSTSSGTAADSTNVHPHGALFAVAVVIGGVLVFVLISIICGWIIRRRWRKKHIRKPLRWDWDPEKVGQDTDTASFVSIGKASSAEPPEPLPWKQDAEVPDMSRSFKDLNPAPLLHYDADGNGTPHLLPAHLRTPAISFPEMTRSFSDTPEMPNTLGPLNVANLMPGDVSQWSRSSASPGTEFGTPNSRMAGTVPRFQGLGTGLPVPWTPQTDHQEHVTQTSSSIAPPGLPVPPQTEKETQEAEQAAADDWASSWKSSLTTALNAVVGSRAVSQESAGRPPVSARQSIYSVNWDKVDESGGSESLTRRSTASIVRGYSMEETSDGKGVVHIHGTRPNLSRSGGSRPSRTFTSRSEAIAEEAEDENGSLSSVSGRETAYSGMESHSERLAKYYASDPPRLPSIVPGQTLTMGEGSGVAHTLSNWANGSMDPRRTGGISRTSTMSAGSSAALSRASSLDPAEREARKVLLMRRRRARALAMSNGSASASGGPTSGRRSSKKSSLKRGLSKRK